MSPWDTICEEISKRCLQAFLNGEFIELSGTATQLHRSIVLKQILPFNMFVSTRIQMPLIATTRSVTGQSWKIDSIIRNNGMNIVQYTTT